MHEVAAAWFREQLADARRAPRAASSCEDRGLGPRRSSTLGYGFAPPSATRLTLAAARSRDSRLTCWCGAVSSSQRDDGTVVDRFRNRLMVPICRDTGAVIAFGGRAMRRRQQPKYLNSPETPIYSKGRTLYGLHLSKEAIRRQGYAVLVEGYFDFAQVVQAGSSERGGLVRHGADAARRRSCSGASRQGRAQLRPRRRGPGGGRALVASCSSPKASTSTCGAADRGEDPDTFVRGTAARHTCRS